MLQSTAYRYTTNDVVIQVRINSADAHALEQEVDEEQEQRGNGLRLNRPLCP